MTSAPEPYASGYVAGAGAAFEQLADVMARLRAPDGCPWDREQTHASLAKHLLEETYETLEVIDAGDAQALKGELGDVLLQVLFHAVVAFDTDEGFAIADVCNVLREKLIRRHPHVFGDVTVDNAEQVVANWERIKRGEGKARRMDGIPVALPSLARASKAIGRARDAGLPAVDPNQDVQDELAELRADPAEHELGDVLFAVAGLARSLHIDPEAALRKATDRFIERINQIEARADLESLSPDEWAEYWSDTK